MKRILITVCIILLLSGCGKKIEYQPFEKVEVDIDTFEMVVIDESNVVKLSAYYPAPLAEIGDSLILLGSEEIDSNINAEPIAVPVTVGVSNYYSYIAQFDKDTLTEKNRMLYNPMEKFCVLADNYVILLPMERTVIDHGEGVELESYYKSTGIIEYYNENLEKVREVTITDTDSVFLNMKFYDSQFAVIEDRYFIFGGNDLFILDLETLSETWVSSYKEYKVFASHYYPLKIPNKFLAVGYLYENNIYEDSAEIAFFCVDILKGEITDVFYHKDLDEDSGKELFSISDMKIYRDEAHNIYNSMVPYLGSIVEYASDNNFTCIDLSGGKIFTYPSDKELSLYKVHYGENHAYLIVCGMGTDRVFDPVYLMKVTLSSN
jgi:hypothetical protein